jgi:hypothetical protein
MARYRVLQNPTFDIETGKLLSHDGESFVESFPIRCDRSVQKTAGQNATTANQTGAGFGSVASGIGSSIIPGLERQASNPTGFDPTTQNRMLVANQEGAGGANAAITGEGRLAALRSRTAGGFAPALAEAARAKGRTLATGGLDVQLENAKLAEQKRRAAQEQLGGMYGQLSQDQLRAMGLANEDLQTKLQAGKTGWAQNLEGILGTVGGMGAGASKGPMQYL